MPQRHVKASRVGASWAEGLNSYSNGGRRQATVYLEHMLQIADCDHRGYSQLEHDHHQCDSSNSGTPTRLHKLLQGTLLRDVLQAFLSRIAS